MRLRTFTAPTVTEAMDMVRRQLGPDAVIISTEPASEGGCLIRAAIDEAWDDEPQHDYQNDTDPLEVIADALAGHGVPPALAQRLASAAIDGLDSDPGVALAGALAAQFRFAPIVLDAGARILLMGPPGAGKTVTIAKLAARQVLRRQPIRIVSTDTVRAGGIEQLAALTRILGLPLGCAEGAPALIRETSGSAAPLIVDTPGFNPYRAAERREIRILAAAARAEPIMVLPAGSDAAETTEIVEACAEIGCRRLVATRIDLARRLGSLVAAADAGNYAFAEAGISPDIADGLCPLTPLGLARLLLPETNADIDSILPETFDRGTRP